MSWNMTKNTSSRGRMFGKSVIYGKDAEHATPYMTRYWLGRLRIHVFHRGDQDPDCHDHPWGFVTFPLHAYVEEYVARYEMQPAQIDMGDLGMVEMSRRVPVLAQRVVRAWRFHKRPATFCHRVIAKATPIAAWNAAHGFPLHWIVPGKRTEEGNIWTIVWRQPIEREVWGFLKLRDGRWCWTPAKDYIFGGGKDAPCGD